MWPFPSSRLQLQLCATLRHVFFCELSSETISHRKDIDVVHHDVCAIAMQLCSNVEIYYTECLNVYIYIHVCNVCMCKLKNKTQNFWALTFWFKKQRGYLYVQ